MQKSLLISAALHIFLFLGFRFSPPKPVVPVSSHIPITVELVENPRPTKVVRGSPFRKGFKSSPNSPKNKRNITLSDLAPKYNWTVPNQKGSYAKNLEKDNSDSLRGGSAMDLLNKPELVYSSYYQRIHDKLDYYWQSKIKSEILKKQAEGKWNYYISKITKTRIILDDQGNLKRVVILSPSGEQELDSSALAAFQDASPFLNPPRALIKNGEVSIEWYFILEINE